MPREITKVKEFWDKVPCNVNHSKKERGVKEYFSEVSKKKYFVEPHILTFANFDEWEGKKVLEIGCGIGTAAQSFVEAGATYTGVDISKTSLDLALQRFDVLGLKGDFYLVDGEEISSIVPIDEYDLIYSFGVIHHTPNPEKLMSEIKKYMGKDTALRVMLYATNSWKSYMIEAGLDRPEAQDECPIANTYTPDEVHSLFEGYKLLNISQTHIFPYKIDKYKDNIYEKQEWFKSMPDEMFSSLEKNLGWHLLIEASLRS